MGKRNRNHSEMSDMKPNFAARSCPGCGRPSIKGIMKPSLVVTTQPFLANEQSIMGGGNPQNRLKTSFLS